ncbi:MAG: gluconate 2-dehydrogenase subunit 3 family protein [Myxococcota bacterium]
MFSRRRLLAFGVGGAAALAAGSAFGWLRLGYSVPPDDRPIALTVKELAVVRAIVDAVLPQDGDLPAGLALGVHQRIDEEVWAQSDAVRADLKSAIGAVEHLPPLFGFAGRLTRLDPPARLAALDAMARRGPGPIVQAVGALRQLCALFYYGHPAVWPALGYGGPRVAASPPASAARYAALRAGR